MQIKKWTMWISLVAVVAGMGIGGAMAASPGKAKAGTKVAVSDEAKADPAAPSKASDAQLKAALELVHFVVPRDIYQQMTQQMIAAMSGELRKQQENLPADFEKRMQDVMAEVLPYDDLLAWAAEIYATRFPVDELHAITAFYKTPVGQKTIKLMPELQGEIGRKVAALMPQKLPAAMKKFGLLPGEAP